MIIELWHHWSLLRMLLMLAFVAPFLIVALFAGRRPRSSRRKTLDASLSPGAIGKEPGGHGAEHRVEASPRQWPGNGLASNHRAA